MSGNAVMKIGFTQPTLTRIERFSTMRSRMMRGIERGMDNANELVIADISANRMTGKGPYPVAEGKLGVVTNRLRSSLRRADARSNGNTVKGSIGTNVKYAGIHEFGFNGQQQVKPFIRRVKSRDEFVKVDRISQKTGKSYRARIKSAQGISFVRGFTRWMQVEARAPIGHGIADGAKTYDEQIGIEMQKEWEASEELKFKCRNGCLFDPDLDCMREMHWQPASIPPQECGPDVATMEQPPE